MCVYERKTAGQTKDIWKQNQTSVGFSSILFLFILFRIYLYFFTVTRLFDTSFCILSVKKAAWTQWCGQCVCLSSRGQHRQQRQVFYFFKSSRFYYILFSQQLHLKELTETNSLQGTEWKKNTENMCQGWCLLHKKVIHDTKVNGFNNLIIVDLVITLKSSSISFWKHNSKRFSQKIHFNENLILPDIKTG